MQDAINVLDAPSQVNAVLDHARQALADAKRLAEVRDKMYREAEAERQANLKAAEEDRQFWIKVSQDRKADKLAEAARDERQRLACDRIGLATRSREEAIVELMDQVNTLAERIAQIEAASRS